MEIYRQYLQFLVHLLGRKKNGENVPLLASGGNQWAHLLMQGLKAQDKEAVWKGTGWTQKAQVELEQLEDDWVISILLP